MYHPPWKGNRVSQSGAALTLRRFFDRVVGRSFGDRADARPQVYFRPECSPPDLPFFRHLITEW